MVCFTDLKLVPDSSSVSFAKPEVDRFWAIGQLLFERRRRLGTPL